MQFDNQKTRNIADIAAKIMYGQQPVEEELKGNQHKIDKNKNNKIDGQDFAILRGQKKANEEIESIDELSKNTLGSYLDKKKSEFMNGKTQPATKEYNKDVQNMGKAHDKMNKEEVELDEVKMADLPSTKVQGRAYGASKPQPNAFDVLKGPKEKDLKSIEAEKKKKKFSEMIDLYNQNGLKSLSEMLAKEESTEDEFNKEVEDAKAKNDGKKKNSDIAKGSVQSVKNEETHTTVEVIDLNDVNGVQYSEIDLEQINELSKGTLNSYVKKAMPDYGKSDNRTKGLRRATSRLYKEDEQDLVIDEAKRSETGYDDLDYKEHDYGHQKPNLGELMRKKLGLKPKSNDKKKRMKEEVEQVDENHMTEPEMKKREEIVKSMKKGMAGFKERYGDRAKNVMYATATKQAMKD